MFLYLPSKIAAGFLNMSSALHLGTEIWYTFEPVGESAFNDLYSLWKAADSVWFIMSKILYLRLIYLDMVLMVD